MISYYIIAHYTFTANFSSKLKSQFQVILGQDFYPMKMSLFQVSLLQNSTNCFLANGWWNNCFYHYSFSAIFNILLVSNILFHMPADGCFWILPVWSHIWYFWISFSCILMQIAPFNVYIQWHSLQIFNKIYLGIQKIQ